LARRAPPRLRDLLGRSGRFRDAPATARIYFDVPEIDACVDCLRELGGAAEPVKSAPGYGR
jgi:hypothetical protein